MLKNKTPENFHELVQYLRQNRPILEAEVLPTKITQDAEKYKSIISFKTEYFYIFNGAELRIEYVSDNMTAILGYEPIEFDMALLFDIIHPDDRPMVIRSTALLTEFARTYLHDKEATAQIDFRQRKKNGDYIRVLRQTAVYQRNAEGLMTHNIAMCTNINGIKKSNQVEFSLFEGSSPIEGFEEIKERIRQEILNAPANIFSDKEIQLLTLLAQGYTSKQIAHALSISPYTVDTHRKNMLQKSKMSNTAELITFAKNNAWI